MVSTIHIVMVSIILKNSQGVSSADVFSKSALLPFQNSCYSYRYTHVVIASYADLDMV